MDNFKIFEENPDNQQHESEYLLGPIVLVNGPSSSSYYVIDGQQRLATLTILLCVIRDVILEDLEKERVQKGAQKESIQKPDKFHKVTELISNTSMGKHQSWKLELNDTDRSFFREIQEYEPNDIPQIERIKSKIKKQKIKSLRFLGENYIFLHEKITEALHTSFNRQNMSDPINMTEDELLQLRIKKHGELLYFLDHVIEKNFLIEIRVFEHSSAFQIFETLNERGQTLSKSNLIKNHILNQVKGEDSQRELSNRWNKIFDEIIEGKNNQQDDEFIIESYNSRYGDDKSLRFTVTNSLPVSKKNLYQIIKNMVNDKNACTKFINELGEDAEFLSMLNEPSTYNIASSKEDIHVLKALKAKFIRTSLLAAYRKWGDKNIKDYSFLVQFLVKFFFKIRVVRQLHPGDIEKIANNITKMINEGKPIKEIIDKLKESDDHDDFIYNFKQKFMPSPQRDAAKYALQQITVKLGTKYDDVKPVDDLTLEHILPSKHGLWNVQDFFKEYKGDNKIEEFKTRLGNMTLLCKAVNSKIQNSQFLDKRDQKDKDGTQIGYASSNLEINRHTVCNYDEWTANIIKQREEDFIQYADKIWNLESYYN